MNSIIGKNKPLTQKGKTYSSDARSAAFLLGGIGTGNFSIGARGEFKDWELFNSPNKGYSLPYTFSSIWAKSEASEPVARVLESRLNPPFDKAHGFDSDELAGLPRLDASSMKGEYPFLEIDFQDEALPVQVSLEAFTPFIPLDADDSGIPCAILRYKVYNPSNVPMDVGVAVSLANAARSYRHGIGRRLHSAGVVENIFKENDKMSGLFFTSTLEDNHLEYGNLALVTSDTNVTTKTRWIEGGWFDGAQDFWDDFTEDGQLTSVEKVFTPGSKMTVDDTDRPSVGSLAIHHTIPPKSRKEFEFVLTWYFPNRPKSWNGHLIEEDAQYVGDKTAIEKNYYSNLFHDAWHVADYVVDNLPRLEKASRDFRYALYSSTLPEYVIEAIANNITVIRSTTCFRIQNGYFLAWEGCALTEGCCEGNCTHVWNYAQTLAFLFPELEQTMRMIEFDLETDDRGHMSFRSNRVFGKPKWQFIPAADGQLGAIVRLYRDWKLSGNHDLLRALWPKVGAALDFALDYWDTDGDFVLDGEQHTTYDIEFHGPNSLTNSLLFAALKAGTEMARHMEDNNRASIYERALEAGSTKMDQMLWNGEYYIQLVEDVDKHAYQYGTGCLSDQLIGQWMAHVAGLGYILPRERVKKAVQAIVKYNFRENFITHSNVQRAFALNDEQGLLLCSWPHGGRPRQPFPYSDEVWTGIEYQVASHLIYEGYVEEGLRLVQAVRERHDGYRRNPWNEVECGNHYARSLASWSLLTALSGYKYDLVEGKMSFEPKINEEKFQCFWSNARAWGLYKQTVNKDTGEKETEIEVLFGDLDDITVI